MHLSLASFDVAFFPYSVPNAQHCSIPPFRIVPSNLNACLTSMGEGMLIVPLLTDRPLRLLGDVWVITMSDTFGLKHQDRHANMM